MVHPLNIALIILGTKKGNIHDDEDFFRSAIELCKEYGRNFMIYIIVPSNSVCCNLEIPGAVIVTANSIAFLKLITKSLLCNLFDIQMNKLIIHYIGHGNYFGKLNFYEDYNFKDFLNLFKDFSISKNTKIFVILDCCYSGLSLFYEDYPSMLVLTSCSYYQLSYVTGGITGFTDRIVKWLKTEDISFITESYSIIVNNQNIEITPVNNFEKSSIYNDWFH